MFYEIDKLTYSLNRWNGTVEKVYGNLSHRKNIQNLDFYQVLGNHDHSGNATVQIEYSHLKGTNKCY